MHRPSGRDSVIRFAVVMAVGYVMGTKAGRQRYEQIAGTYRAVTGSPKTQGSVGRRAKEDRRPGVTRAERWWG